MKTPSDLPAEYFIELTGIPRRTFYNRVISKGVRYLDMFNGVRLYSVKHWNKLNSDYKMPSVLPD